MQTNVNKDLSLSIMFKVQNKSNFLQDYQAGIRDFRYTILTAVSFAGTSLEQINLDESNLIEINWSNCSLNQASLRKAFLGLSNFKNCHLQFTNLQEANLLEADLEGADLEGADLRGANLQQANLKGANLTGARLENACLTGAVYNSQTVFDADFTPETVGMILATSGLSHAPDKTNFGGRENNNSLKKMLSWCLFPRSN